MDASQISEVQRSFALLVPQADAVAASFYERLFELEPSLRALFKPDLAAQRASLMAMLAAGVAGLDRLDTLRPTLGALGARHTTYGVQQRHYDIVAAALLDTLDSGLGEVFTPSLREAWTRAYTLLAEAMQAGTKHAMAA